MIGLPVDASLDEVRGILDLPPFGVGSFTLAKTKPGEFLATWNSEKGRLLAIRARSCRRLRGGCIRFAEC